MTPLSSKDCHTTEQKAAFMLEACKPEWKVFIAEDRECDIGGFVTDGSHRWNFERYTYELRPAPLTAEQKVKAMLDVLDHPELQHNIVIAKAVAIGKGESRGD